MTQTDTSKKAIEHCTAPLDEEARGRGYGTHIAANLIRALAAERDQAQQQLAAARNDALAEMSRMIKAAILGGKVGAGDGNTHYLRTISTGEVDNIELALRAQVAPTSEQKVHENWPAPFHKGFWAIVDADGAIQEGAHGWAISPDSELGAWERLLEPCQDWSVCRAKENGDRAAFFPSANSLRKVQTIQEEQTNE